MQQRDARPDMVVCVLHKRRRRPHEMCPMPGQPGQMRCLPHKECFVRDANVELVTCSLHGRRRNRGQMLEVRDGVFECQPNYPCRNITGTGRGFHDDEQPDTNARGQRRPEPAVAAASNFRHTGVSRHAPAALAHMAVADSGQAEVWCARHGKKVLRAFCQHVDGSHYVCTDATACVSGALEAVQSLVHKGCNEVICARHHALRRLAFVTLADNASGYVCVEGHPCRAGAAQRGGAVDAEGGNVAYMDADAF